MSFHVNPETGDAGKCRAQRGKCPFGSEYEHYPTAEAARKAYEEEQELWANKKEYPLSQAAVSALSADLTPKPAPKWLNSTARIQKEFFGSEPEYLGTISTVDGDLAVVWEKDSIALNDRDVQLSRGYETSRITLNNPKTGAELGYIKLGSQTKESLDRSFGTDKYRAFAWAEDAGGLYGFSESEKVKGKWVDRVPVREETGEALLEAKKELWVGAHKKANIIPSHVDREELGYTGVINLSVKHAPEDEATLDKELEAPRKVIEKEMKAITGWHDDPIIDYISIDDSLRGKGTGQALYVLAGRQLAKQGRVLRASGIQTYEAQSTWRRMDADPNIPTGTVTKTSPRSKEKSTYLTIDFRDKGNS